MTGHPIDEAPPGPNLEDRSFRDVLESHIGDVFLVANPEAYEEGGLGPAIKFECYKVKLIGMGKDYLITITQFTHGAGKHATKEAVRQYIPISRIKRISLKRDEPLLHL